MTPDNGYQQKSKRKMTKFCVAITHADTPFWKERQLRLCWDLGVQIDFHGNPSRMWVFANQDGQKAMAANPEVEDFVVAGDQAPLSTSSAEELRKVLDTLPRE